MAGVKRGHHTVPRFYLDRFAADDHKLGVARLSTKKRFQMSTGDASVVRDFYNIDSRADPNAVEDLLSEIEGDTAAVFRKVIDDGSWPLDANDRVILSTFLALQRTRTPSQRRMVEEIKETVTRIAADAGIPSPIDLDDEDSKTVHIQTMLDIEQYAPHYFGRRWVLVRFGRKRLLTCDAPVGLLSDPDAPADAALGIGTAWLILFPLSPDLGLMMIAPDEDDEPFDVAHGRNDTVLEGSTYLAKIFNETTIDSAFESIFHHPGDANLLPVNLPSPEVARLKMGPGTTGLADA